MKNIGVFFDKLVKKHGHTIQALDYGSKRSQELKFKMIAETTDFNNKSVLDIGCGFADLKDYLEKRNKLHLYSGVEASKKIVAWVKENKPETIISHGTWPVEGSLGFSKRDIKKDEWFSTEKDLFQLFDITVMNGVLYLYPFRETLKMIETAWQVTHEVLIFDCLSKLSLIPDGRGEYHFSPDEVLPFISLMTPYICLRHELSKNFFMCYMYRSKHR